MNELPKPRLHLVKTNTRVPPSAADFQVAGPQRQLFPIPKKGLLIFVYFPEVTEAEFVATFEYAKPAFVFELRTAPRFDIGQLNRQTAFQIFQSQNSQYYDITSSTMGTRSDLSTTLAHLDTTLRGLPTTNERPLVFLISRNEADESFVDELIRLANTHDYPAELYEVPRFIAQL